MKVERINDVQIKFILTKTDLEKRSIDISELSYGSIKTQELFQDIVETALKEFAFNLEDTPLMIEAIPMSKNSITIMLTKVSGDPKKMPQIAKGLMKKMENITKQNTKEDDSMIKVPSRFASESTRRKEAKKVYQANANKCIVYSFASLDEISETSKLICNLKGKSSIYKYKDEYMLALEVAKDKNDKMQIINRILSEHGNKMPGQGELVKAYLYENAEKIIDKNAIQIMAKL